jgi:orotate phosphoribosyltransferase
MQFVRDIINHECIARVPPESKELPGLGGVGFYQWQFYLRRVLLDPICLDLSCDDFWRRFGKLFDAEPFQLVGLEAAALPLIAAIIIGGKRRGRTVHAFTVRKERKAYGLRNLIEGIPSRAPVMFIDDLTSPHHNAFWAVMNAVRQAGLVTNGHGYVLVRKLNADDPTIIPTSLGSVQIASLFSLSDFDMTLAEYQTRGPWTPSASVVAHPEN